MMLYKRAFLIILTFVTFIFIGYQLYLIISPLRFNSPEASYVHLVDQYQLIKMQRLVLEEECALAKTKERVLKLAQELQPNDGIGGQFPFSATAYLVSRAALFSNQTALSTLQPSQGHPQHVALSLKEAQTFEQLEAYVSSTKLIRPEPTTKDEKSLLNFPAENFTLQLMGVRDIVELTRFIETNNIQNAQIFHTYYLNKDWYVLVSGNYKNHTEALKAIDTLPDAAKNLKPWIRQLSSVQKAIQLYR